MLHDDDGDDVDDVFAVFWNLAVVLPEEAKNGKEMADSRKDGCSDGKGGEWTQYCRVVGRQSDFAVANLVLGAKQNANL